jgi:membrane protein YqaA with SNARE-associated domain
MKGMMAWAQGVALSFGGPGLFFVAFLDSSFLSLPEVNDFLVVWMVTKNKDRLLYYASLATLGSIAGCFVLYWLAWKGGEAVLKKWFKDETIDRAAGQIRRYGLLALLVPSILPPPAPFKVFVLLAGVVRIRPLSFTLAIAIGRGFRYFAEGLLAVWYGDMALQYIDEHGNAVALWTAILVLVAGLAYVWWRRRQSRQPAQAC